LLLGALKAGIVLCIVVFLLYLIPYQGLQDVLANTVFIQNVEVFLLKIFPIA
jgi:hypothetical protein